MLNSILGKLPKLIDLLTSENDIKIRNVSMFILRYYPPL